MIKIGLTGNIGSGKTIISHIFKILGIPVYNADFNAKKAFDNTDVFNNIVLEFGPKILTNNYIDKVKLANLVFNHPVELLKLNNIIHPFVKNDFNTWCNTMSKYEIIVLEAAILFESNFEKNVDKTIIVTSPKSLRIQRIIKRDEINEDEIEMRMKNQWDEEIKIQLSDYIIENNEQKLIIPQVFDIINKIKQNR